MKVLPCFLLATVLAAGTSLAVDVNWLTGIVDAITTEYNMPGIHFSLAVAIPQQQNIKTFHEEVLQNDRFNEDMRNTIRGGEVYEGSRVILAVPAGPVHAENIVLNKLQHLNNYRLGNFLLIYSYLSPCTKCTDWDNKYNILGKIENHVHYWSDSAFVFKRVFDKPKSEPGVTRSREEIENSLYALGCSMGGLRYTFRCDTLSNSGLECHSCSVHNRASEFCINSNAGPQQAGSSRRDRSQSESSSRSSEGRRSRSSSESRDSSISRNRGGGSSRKRNVYRSQSESSISSRSGRKAGKNKGGGRMSRKRGKYRSQSGSRRSISSG